MAQRRDTLQSAELKVKNKIIFQFFSHCQLLFSVFSTLTGIQSIGNDKIHTQNGSKVAEDDVENQNWPSNEQSWQTKIDNFHIKLKIA